MFDKILIGMDGSENALHAARTAALVAAHFHAQALVVNVFVPAPIFHLTLGAEGAEQRMHQRAQWQEARLRLESLPLFTEKHVPCEFKQIVGHPVGGLVDVARDQAADLIVVGNRGLRGLQEWVMGSVSRGVLHHAPCSVLVVRPDATGLQVNPFRHILLVSDGSDGANRAAQAAIQMAQRFSTSLTILNVYEEYANVPLNAGEGYVPPYVMDTEAAASASLRVVEESVRSIAQGTGVFCSFHQEIGYTNEAILRFAKEQGADLIVMGSRGLGGFGRMLLGSVSDHIAHHATCPVLVAR